MSCCTMLYGSSPMSSWLVPSDQRTNLRRLREWVRHSCQLTLNLLKCYGQLQEQRGLSDCDEEWDSFDALRYSKSAI